VDLLTPQIPNVIVMAGGMGKNQRKRLAEQIASIPADQSRVIVATGRYLGEGFDDELLDALFPRLPISAWDIDPVRRTTTPLERRQAGCDHPRLRGL
jgi:hypothetical protein